MTDFLSPQETQTVQPGSVVVNTGLDVWKTWANANTLSGATVGVVSIGGMPGTAISVVTIGRFPYAVFNLGAGNASNVVAGNVPSRGSVGQVIGTCDAAGEIFLLPTQVGSASTITGIPSVGSIATLRNTVTNASNAIMLLGYSSAGDGGGGQFVWSPTDTRADNGGTIVAVTGVSTGRWNRVYAGDVDVRWFGAVADGVTDNTTAINNAIAACSGTVGGTVTFSAGIYLHTGTISLANGVSLSGQGEALTTLQKNTLGDGILTSSPINGSTRNVSRVSRMRLDNTLYPTIPAWTNPHTYSSGNMVIPAAASGALSGPSGISNKVLKCVTGGASGTIQPIGKLFPSTATASRVPDVTLTRVPTTDHTVDIKIVVAGALGTMQFQYSVDGGALSGSQTTTAGSSFSFAVPGTQYTAVFSGTQGSYTAPLIYWSPTARWSMSNMASIQDGTGTLTWQILDAGAAYHDQSSTGIHVDHVLVTGYAIGAILDQTEDGTLSNFYASGLLVGVWLVNGAAAIPDSATLPVFGFTNENRVVNSTILCTIGVLHDGGLGNVFIGCDLESAAPVVTAGSNSTLYSGCYIENVNKAIAGGQVCAFRLLFSDFFSRAESPSQGPIEITSCLLGTAANFVIDATPLQSLGSTTQTTCSGLNIHGNSLQCSSATYIRGAGSLGGAVWVSNPNSVFRSIFDTQPGSGVMAFDGGVGFNGVAGRLGGVGLGFLNDGQVNATLDVGGGLALRESILSNIVVFGNGNNNNVSLQYGFTTNVISNGPTAAWTITGLAAPPSISVSTASGHRVQLENLTGQPMTISHNDANSSVGNRIFLSSGASVTCKAITLMYLNTVATPGWYEVAISGATVGGDLTGTLYNPNVATVSGNTKVALTASGLGGPSGTPLTLLSSTGIALTNVNVTLSAAQIATPIIPLTGTLTGNVVIVLPNATGIWYFDVSGLTFSTFNLSFQSGSATTGTYVAADVTAKTDLITVVTRGSNTIASSI